MNEVALQRARKGESGAEKIPGEVWDARFIERGGFRDEVFQGGIQEILEFYDQLHQQVLVLIVNSRISAVYEHA